MKKWRALGIGVVAVGAAFVLDWMPYHRERLTANRIRNIQTWNRNGALNS